MLQFKTPPPYGRPASPEPQRPYTVLRRRPRARRLRRGIAGNRDGVFFQPGAPDSLLAMSVVRPGPGAVSGDKPYSGGSRRHEHAASESRLRARWGTPCSDSRGASRLRAEAIDRKGRDPRTGFHVKRPGLLRARRKPFRSTRGALRTLLCRKGRRHRRMWPRLLSYAESMFHVKLSRRTGLGARN